MYHLTELSNNLRCYVPCNAKHISSIYTLPFKIWGL